MTSMNLGCVLSLLTLMAAILSVEGYGSGAPDKACENMKPGHIGINPQTSAPSYKISVTTDAGAAVTKYQKKSIFKGQYKKNEREFIMFI